MQSDIEKIEASIVRYQALRRHSNPAFAQQLAVLKRWQHQRMEKTYAALLSASGTQSLVHYFLEDIYGGIDLSEVIKSLSRSLKIAGKLFSDLSLIRIALEFNTLNAEIDEALTEALLHTQHINQINAENYADAMRAAGLLERHLRSIALVGEFAEGLDETVHNALVYGAFVVAKLPAKLGGLGKLYQLLEKGFEVIRALPSAEQTIGKIVAYEKEIHLPIGDGQPLSLKPM